MLESIIKKCAVGLEALDQKQSHFIELFALSNLICHALILSQTLCVCVFF